MYILGYDIGSSSVKASLIDAQTGACLASDFYPKQEMAIHALKAGWAEQQPEQWWENLKQATQSVLGQSKADSKQIKAIGISYQMHGLVVIDKDQNVLRESIIWCDSRAVPYGSAALEALGAEYCLPHLLNSPGNFTAAKLAWVKENEPELFDRIDKILLPGDYIAMRLTGEATTTVSGLSEGIFWDFKQGCISKELLAHFGFSESIIPRIVPTFGLQGSLSAQAAQALGLTEGTEVTYRAGDQPNNALSLNVLEPGEVAATAGTSGVVYGINEHVNYDPKSRVNTFAHVNHTAEKTRLGVLLCINGTAILNSWIKRNVATEDTSYAAMNDLAASVPIGAEGLSIIPFGNGAERMLENKETGASIHNLNYNIHDRRHLMRAAQEGIAFSFKYGMEVMEQMGISTRLIRAGHANLFLSPLFRQALSNISNSTIELYDTDGAAGAAKGAGIGAGIYASAQEAFASLRKIEIIEPSAKETPAYQEAYLRWKNKL